MNSPIVLTSATTVNAMGRGLKETIRALRSERSGLSPNDFEDAGERLSTYIGRVPGIETAPVTGQLAAFDCRNNRLAKMALETDGFTGAVERAVAAYGSDRIAVVMGSSTSGVGACEAAYRQRAEAGGGEDGELPGSFRFDETHDF